MGRHSSPEQAPYLRSLAGWVLPWVLVAAVAVVAVGVGVSALGQQPIDAPPPRDDRRQAAASPSPEPSLPPADGPSPTPTKTDRDRARDGEPKKRREERRDRDEPALRTEGLTTQVLNATDSPTADEAMTRRLRGLGFEIVAVVTAAHAYRDTTVFWSSTESRAAARALARRFGWLSDPKPTNLSPNVDIHVVVGADEA